MKRFATMALTTALTLAALPPATTVWAQGPGQFTPPETLSIEFAGGTVTQYIDALKKSGKAVNVVASERAAKQPLAPISLSQVSVGVAVYAIEAASTASTGSWIISTISVGGHRNSPYPMPNEAFSVDFYPYGKRGQDVVVESYSLQKILRTDGKGGGFDSKIVLTAIETGLKLQNEPGEQPPDLQFHADSGLLFVRGSTADVRLVGSVVSRLADDAKARTSAAERRAQASVIRTIATKEATLDIQLQEAELGMAMRAFEQAQKLAEKGTIPASEMARLEMDVSRAKFRLDKARLGLERAQIVPTDPMQEDEPAQPAAEATPAGAPQQPQPGAAPGKAAKRPAPK